MKLSLCACFVGQLNSDALDSLIQILVHGTRAHSQLCGDFLEREILVKAQVKDAPVGLFEPCVDKGVDLFQLFDLSLDGLLIIGLADWQQFPGTLAHVLLSDGIEAAVAHSTHQVTLGLVLGHLVLMLHQARKHVLHHILGLGTIGKQGYGKINHLTVMLPKEAFHCILVKHISVSLFYINDTQSAFFFTLRVKKNFGNQQFHGKRISVILSLQYTVLLSCRCAVLV